MATAKEQAKINRSMLPKYETNWFVLGLVVVVSIVSGFFIYTSFAGSYAFESPISNLKYQARGVVAPTTHKGSPGLNIKSEKTGSRIGYKNNGLQLVIKNPVVGRSEVCFWGVVNQSGSSVKLVRVSRNVIIKTTANLPSSNNETILYCDTVLGFGSTKYNLITASSNRVDSTNNISNVTLTKVTIEKL